MSKKQRSDKIPVFIRKLRQILEDGEASSSISWNQNGKSFQIYDIIKFSSEVLPKYFKHSNLASFVRQLNIYGFTKVKSQDNHVYEHQDFQMSEEIEGTSIRRKNLQKQRQQREQKKQIQEIVQIEKEQKFLQIRCDQLSKQNRLLRFQNQEIKRQITEIKDQKQKMIEQSQKMEEDSQKYSFQSQKIQIMTHKSSFRIIQNTKTSNGYQQLLVNGKQSEFNDINCLFNKEKQRRQQDI